MVDQLAEIPISPSAASPAGELVRPATFLAGPENRLVAVAMRRLLAAATEPAGAALSPLYLWGPSGCGKTHLAQGIVRHWQEHLGAESAEYLTAADFRRELGEAINHRAVDAWRERIRGRALVALDDAHRLPPDAHLNEELIHTIDALGDQGALLVLTSHEPPGAASNLSPNVGDRCGAGLVLSVAAPGPEVRAEFVRQVSHHLGHALSPDEAAVVAARVQGHLNQLAAVVTDLIHGIDRPPALNSESIVRYLDERSQHLRPPLAEILRVVARYYTIPQKTLKGSSRRQSVVLARAMAIYLARRLACLSYQQIGKALSGRDHTTIMHSYQKTLRLADHDLATQQAISDLERLLAVP